MSTRSKDPNTFETLPWNSTQYKSAPTCDRPTTWLASSLIGKAIPSSDEKEFMGDNVPEVNMSDRTSEDISENTWEEAKKEAFDKTFVCVCVCVCA